MTRLLTLLVLLLIPHLAPGLRADPVISEFMASNVSSIQDEDNTPQDWIEIHNPTSSAINLSGWCLTDSAGNRGKWVFPAQVLAPGEFLVVFASGKDRRVAGQPLHTNFSLAKSGEYLALVRPGGTVVAQEYAPEYPPLDDDESHGLVFTRTTLVAEAATAAYRVPLDAGQLPSDWNTAAATPSGWSSGPSGLGFGITIPGFQYLIRAKNTATGTLDSQAAAELLLSRPDGHPDILFQETGTVPVMNLLGNGADGRYGANIVPPTWAVDHYVYRVTGIIEIPTAGAWTFGLNSDDGGKITIDGNVVMNDPTFHGPQDHLGTVTLTAGPHTIEAYFWEAGGGDEGELFAAPGTFTAWNTNMRLVGDTANGGLPVYSSAAGPGGANPVRTNIQASMLNQNASAFTRFVFPAAGTGHTSLSLAMRHNDGFTAWLNGVPVASVNAPASPVWNSSATAARGVLAAMVPQGFNVTAALSGLQPAGNILAIQGLNVSAADTSFLVLPELVAASLPPAPVSAFFHAATPGVVNGPPDSLGKVDDPAFSPNRGFYPNTVVTNLPFAVTLTCATPGASIRYTTDGSTPTDTVGTLYTGPIPVGTTTVIRAVAYRADWETSPVDTHSYIIPQDVVRQSPLGQTPAGWPAPDGNGRINGQVMDFGMDPEIVDHANPALGGAAQVTAALLAIPSVSIATDLPNLFSTSTGIYVNPYGRGLAWERPCSVELLNDPAGGFQENAGLRLRGGYSRSTDNPKHALRFFFRAEYGAGRLDYPVFGEEDTAVRSFDQIDLRTAQNYSWSFGGDGQNSFLREEFSRRTFVEMGRPGSHVKYVHVYLNGQYWGLFNFDERTEADHCAAYVGGVAENWDVVKAEQDSGYVTGATDGDLGAWHQLFAKANPLVAPGTYTRRALTPAEYHDLQGLAPDGVTTNASPVLLDVDALIDYMLITFWTGNFDGATSNFLGNDRANNWFGARDRTARRGFQYFVHDFEHSLFNTNEDRTGPYNRTFTDLAGYNTKRDYYNPMFLHADLLDVPAYKARWHDRVQLHLFNGGALSLARNTARVQALAGEIDTAIIAESARWGDAKVATPFTRANWLGQRDQILNTYLPQRTAAVIAQLRADGLYPALDAVQFAQPGGYTVSTAPLLLTGPTTPGVAWYYTLDGSDPRGANGLPSASAQIYTPQASVTNTLVNWGADGPGATWKYRDPSIDLGGSDIVVGHPSYSASNWKHPDFDDSNASVWRSGDAELGNGDTSDGRPERTVINIGPNNPRFPVLYFRKKFTVTDAAAMQSLLLEAMIDDGAIFYLNGREAARTNLAARAFGYEYGTTTASAAHEGAFLRVTDSRLLPSLLVEGTNTICVQVHNASAASSDLSFDLRLRGVRTVFSNPVLLPPGEVVVNARAFDGAAWSALSTARFLVDAEPASSNNVVVSEIQYNPSVSVDDVLLGYNEDTFFEYLELQNIGPRKVDLLGVEFTRGVTWSFGADALVSRLLDPGQRVVIAGHAEGFARRHGGAPSLAGIFTGQLSNGGENLTLLGASGAVVRDFAYSDLSPWPAEADGFGASLVLLRPGTNPDHSLPSSWRASVGAGNPGSTDAFNYAAWKALHAAGQGDFTDVDGDGLPLFWEYVHGGDAAATDAGRLPAVADIPGFSPQFVYELRAGADDLSVTPEFSTNLVAWTTTPLRLVSRIRTPAGNDRYTYDLAPPHDGVPRGYLRLRSVAPAP